MWKVKEKIFSEERSGKPYQPLMEDETRVECWSLHLSRWKVLVIFVKTHFSRVLKKKPKRVDKTV